MVQPSLFPEPAWEHLDAPDATIALMRDFIVADEGMALLRCFVTEVPWRKDTLRVYGREHPLPRLQQWFGDPGRVYTWSGIRMDPLPWTSPVLDVKRRVEDVTGRKFNSVLLNLYRDGADTVGWHADNEPELGEEPFIASVSLGATRDFVLRHTDPAVQRLRLSLAHGSLLLMSGRTQSFWQHALPRRKGVIDPRVNLTFRTFGKSEP